MFHIFNHTQTRWKTHPLVLTWNKFILFQKTVQLESYTILLNYVRYGGCGGRVYQHITVFILLISITIFLNKGTAQDQFYFKHAGVAEFRKMVCLFFPGKKLSSHLIKVEVVVRIHDTRCLNSAVCDTVNLLCLKAQELTGEQFSCLLVMFLYTDCLIGIPWSKHYLDTFILNFQ